MGIAGQGATLGVAISIPPLHIELYPFSPSAGPNLGPTSVGSHAYIPASEICQDLSKANRGLGLRKTSDRGNRSHKHSQVFSPGLRCGDRNSERTRFQIIHELLRDQGRGFSRDHAPERGL